MYASLLETMGHDEPTKSEPVREPPKVINTFERNDARGEKLAARCRVCWRTAMYMI
jgi:hypothetical protein